MPAPGEHYASLARVQVLDEDGHDLDLPAMDIGPVYETTDGSKIVMRDGTIQESRSTVTQVHDAIDALWTEATT